MKKSAFTRFFLFTISIIIVLGIFLFIFSKLLQLEVSLLYELLYLGFCLYCGVGMGLFGHFYARNTTIYINNKNYTIHNIEDMLYCSKYTKLKETNNEIVFNANKYHEWFYGKIHIKNNGDKITINAAKCIINKYFANIR